MTGGAIRTSGAHELGKRQMPKYDMQITSIERCIQCRHCKREGNQDYDCSHPVFVDLKRLTAQNRRNASPDWCPLPDLSTEEAQAGALVDSYICDGCGNAFNIPVELEIAAMRKDMRVNVECPDCHQEASYSPCECEGCNTTTDVEFAPCPYAQDIHGDEDCVWLCEDCRHQRAQET